MSKGWGDLRQRADHARADRVQASAGALPWASRMDVLLAGIVLLILAAVLALGLGLAYVAGVRPLFDPAVIEPIPDDRILANVHQPDAAPFVDALALRGRAETIFAREDGTLHVLDEMSRLFRDTDPFQEGVFETPLVNVASTCSTGVDCPADEVILAFTQANGLAELGPQGWNVLISDQAWRGWDGSLVQQDDIVSWGVDPSGRWIFLATAANGVAVFDQTQNIWGAVRFTSGAETALRAATIRQTVQVTGGAAVATDRGLFTASRVGNAWQVAAVPELDDGVVLDLTASQDDRVLLTYQGPCGTSGTGCLSIWEGRPGGAFSRVIGENEVHPALGLASINHVAQQGRYFVTFGASGIHRYDPNQRAWEELSNSNMEVVHATQNGAEVYFASGSTAGVVRDGAIAEEWDLAETRLRQIIPVRSPTASVVGLTQEGLIIDVASGEALTHEDVAFDPSREILDAVGMGAVLTLVSRDGVFLLHTERRRRVWIEADQLPIPLTGNDLSFAGHPQGLWYWRATTGEIGFLRLSGDWPAMAFTAEPSQMTGVAISSVVVEDRQLSISFASGQFVRATVASGVQLGTPVGAPIQGTVNFTSMAADGEDLLFSDGTLVSRYNAQDRGWDQTILPIGNEQILDISYGDRLFALTQTGRVYGLFPDQRTWELLFGGGFEAPFGRDELSDAMQAGQDVLLAGGGAVMRVDPVSLQIEQVWGGGSGAVLLLGLHQERPVWRANGVVWWGDDRVTPDGFQSSGAVFQSGVLLEHLTTASASLARRVSLSTGGAACLANTSTAPTEDVLGGRVLPDGRVYIQTAGQTHLYVEQERRWLRVQQAQLGSTGPRHSYVAQDWLFDFSGDVLRGVPLAAIPRPDSCADQSIAMPWVWQVAVADVAIDQSTGRLAVLLPSGEVQSISNGQFRTELAAPLRGPSRDQLERVLEFRNGALFAGRGMLWQYDPSTRLWEDWQLSGAGPSVREGQTSVEAESDGIVVTHWNTDGGSWGYRGPLVSATQALTLQRLSPADLPPFAHPPQDLVDIARHSDRWWRLTDRELSVSNATTTLWEATLDLGSSSQDRTLAVQGEWVLITDTSVQNDPVIQIVPQHHPTWQGTDVESAAATYRPRLDQAYALTTRAVERNSVLWRLDQTGRLFRCAIRPGTDLNTGCELISDAPLEVAESAIGRVYQVGASYLTEDNGQLFWYSEDLRQRRAANLPTSAMDRVFQHEGRTYAFDASTGGLFAITDGEVTQHEGTFGTVFSAGSSVWAETPIGRPLSVSRTGLTDAFELETEPVFAPTVAENGVRFWINVDGQPRSNVVQPGAVLDGLPTDATVVLPGQIRHSTSGATLGGWWTQAPSGAVQFDYNGTCERPGTPFKVVAQGAETRRVELDAEAQFTPPQDLLDIISEVDTSLSVVSVPIAPLDGKAPHPTPISFACQRQLLPNATIVLAGRLRVVSAGSEGATILRSDAQTLTLAEDGTVQSRSPATEPALPFPNIMGDDRNELVSEIEVIEGRSLLAPSSLQPNGARLRIAADIRSLTADVATRQDLPAMNETWLRWDRSSGQFVFAASDGSDVSMTPQDAIFAGSLLPDQSGRAAMRNDGGFAYLTAQALWRYSASGTPSLQLVGPFDAPLGLSRGEFVLPTEGLDADTGATRPMDPSHEVQLADLTLREDILRGQISGALPVANATSGRSDEDPFAGTGFLFDRRSGVGFDGGTLIVQSAIGFGPASRLADFDQGPSASGPTGRLFPEGGLLRLQIESQWWARNASEIWTSIGAPSLNLEIGQTPRRIWAIDQGALRIDPSAGGPISHAARAGLAFDTDQIRSVVAEGEDALLVTAATTERLSLAAPLAGPSSQSAAPLVAPNYPEALRDGSGSWHAFSGGGSSPIAWQRSVGQWGVGSAASNSAPAIWDSRLPLSIGPIVVEFQSVLGRVEATYQMQSPSNAPVSRAFIWEQGRRLPQNVATAIHAEANVATIGTQSGLLVLDANAMTAPPLFDLSLTPNPATVAVSVARLGRPEADMSRLVALSSDNGCWDLGQGTTPSASTCAAPVDLNRRAVAQTPLWHWWEADRSVGSAYVMDAQVRSDRPALLRQGFWSHDRAVAWSQNCGGSIAHFWQDYPVFTTRMPTLGGVVELPEPARDLTCIADEMDLGQGQVAPDGLYLNASAAGGWHLIGGAWTRASQSSAQAARSWADGARPIEADRYRISYDDRRIQESYQSIAGDWIDLNPDGARGGFSMDETLAIGRVDGQLVRITPAGVLAPILVSGDLGIGPDRLHLWTRPSDESGLGACAFDAIAARDGEHHGLPEQAANDLLMRCEAGVFSVDLDPAFDVGAIVALEDDPLREADLAGEPGGLHWQRADWPVGGLPDLAVTFRDETVPFSGGRLGMDAYSGIADAASQSMDMTSAIGWWQSSRATDFALPGLTRPEVSFDVASVSGVSADLDGNGDPALCVVSPDQFVLIGVDALPRQVEVCGQAQGRDSVWTYRDFPERSDASGLARNGPVLSRSLVEGRFSDLSVSGQPMLSTDGRELLLPSANGAIAFDRSLNQVSGYYALPGVMGLVPDDAGHPVAIGTTGALALDPEQEVTFLNCPATQTLGSSISRENPRVFLTRTALNRLSLRMTSGDERMLAELSCDAPDAHREQAGAFAVDTALRYRGNASRWAAGPVLSLHVPQGGALVLGDDEGRTAIVDPVDGLPDGSLLAMPVATNGHGVYLVTEQSIFAMDRDAALEHLYSTDVVAFEYPEPEPEPETAVVPAVPIEDVIEPAPVEPAEVALPPIITPVPDSPEPAEEAPLVVEPGPVELAPDEGLELLLELTQAAVSDIQKALSDLGFDTGPVDGVIGPRTRSAIEQFQRQIGAPVTGALTVGQFQALTLQSAGETQ